MFYRDGSGDLVAVPVRTSPSFSIGRAVPLFSVREFSTDFDRDYTVSPDDRRFLFIRPVSSGGFDKLIMVENWFEELKGQPRK